MKIPAGFLGVLFYTFMVCLHLKKFMSAAPCVSCIGLFGQKQSFSLPREGNAHRKYIRATSRIVLLADEFIAPSLYISHTR